MKLFADTSNSSAVQNSICIPVIKTDISTKCSKPSHRKQQLQNTFHWSHNNFDFRSKASKTCHRTTRNMWHKESAIFLLSVFTLLLLMCSLGSASEISFIKDFYNVSIKENSLPRTYVKGVDLMGVHLSSVPDSGHLQYTIVSGDPEGFFAVEKEEIGGISVLHIRTKTGLRDVLNRERQSSYTLKVSAHVRSAGALPMSASTVVRVVVEDTNDNIPLFYPDSYSVNAPEDLQLNADIVQVRAHDADYGINGEVYYYLRDTSTNWFAVHPTTGIVSLTRPLYTHPTKNFHLKVLARDRGRDVTTLRDNVIGQASVDVSVIAMNNAPPKITVKHLPNVVEHAHAHIYGILTVTDIDDGPSGDIDLVEIIDGDPDKVFSIARGEKNNEYNLMVLRLLDRELAPAGYNLTVRATDRGRPPASSERSVSVVIADVNDHAPVFVEKSYDVSVSEEAPPQTPVVRLLATDSDQGKNGEVKYSITSGNSGKPFIINPNSGVISTTEWLDAEAKSYYSLSVSAFDLASPAVRKKSSVQVVIRVLDANDNIPTFLDVDDTISIDENEPAGSFVTRINAADSDSTENGFLSYSIINGNQVPFTIDPFDGVIRTAKILDYESDKKSYTLHLRVSDWGDPYKHETQTIMKVNVEDVNDNRPQFLSSDCYGWLSSNTHQDRALLTLKAVDLDVGDRISYRIVGNDNPDCWDIDPNYGILTPNCNLRTAVLKRARSRTVVLNVTATDGRYISDPISVTLNVIDPQYSDKDNVFYGKEIKCKPTEAALDLVDAELSSHVTELSVDNDYQAQQPVVSGNTHAPRISSKTPSKVEVVENAKIGSELFTVEASDDDHGYNGRRVYSISSGNVDSAFEINMITGVVTVSGELDREKTAKYYSLGITVYDLGQPRLHSNASVTIDVLDVNDNAPQFLRFLYHLHLPENTRLGTTVAQLQAVDKDDGSNGVVSYELVSRVNEFKMHPATGVLEVVQPLDRERTSHYELRVRAWDDGEEERLYSTTVVHITVLDINDCAPDFGAARYVRVNVPEDYPLGTVIGTLRATDLDIGPSGVVQYSLVNNDKNTFRIDRETGVIRIAAALDYEQTRLYNLTIRAQDKG